MPNKRGTGLLMVFCDVPADKEKDFNKWYNEEHLPDLLTVPGVLSAARYEAVKSGPKHLAVYELETAAVLQTSAWKDRPRSAWAQRVGPRVIGKNFINNAYEMIHPAKLTPKLAQADMSPALQIGRMDAAPQHDAEWNKWYNEVYTANYQKVPGCLQARRWRVVAPGTPKYAVVYEFNDVHVSETAAWEKQRDINPNNPKMRSYMTHATGSPGVWQKTFQP
ncbi:MAG: hypothetical protein EXR54_07285 [Dehalococcoidia bacterium]|nr:hypothetical protein [Dehalococcoidia bacterium]MSQ17353.1 hypothetical protein [Dehalococcoidia bacterium]